MITMRPHSMGFPIALADSDYAESGFLGLGKKDKEHQEAKRKFEVADMKRKEATAAADAELEALERKIKMAELQKRAKEIGLSAPAAASAAAEAAGFMVIGNVGADVPFTRRELNIIEQAGERAGYDNVEQAFLTTIEDDAKFEYMLGSIARNIADQDLADEFCAWVRERRELTLADDAEGIVGYAGEDADYADALRAIKAIHRGWHRDADSAGLVVIGNLYR